MAFEGEITADDLPDIDSYPNNQNVYEDDYETYSIFDIETGTNFQLTT